MKYRQDDINLLKADLCARLPYGVIVKDRNGTHVLTTGNTEFADLMNNNKVNIKPYLRPMQSITKEELNELKMLMDCDSATDCSLEYAVGGCVDYDDFLVYYEDCAKLCDWLNKRMLNWRNLPDEMVETPTEETYK